MAPLLLEHATKAITGGGELRDFLAVIPAGADAATTAAAIERFDRIMQTNRDQKRRVVIIGEVGGIADVRPGKQRAAVFFKGMQANPWRALWDQRMIESTRRRFPIATALAANVDARVVAVITGEVDEKGRKMVDVHVCSLLPLSREFISVESSYELYLVRMMAKAQRAFSKLKNGDLIEQFLAGVADMHEVAIGPDRSISLLSRRSPSSPTSRD